MRKKLWACAVVAAVVAVGGGLAVDYAWQHPDSWLGRYFCPARAVAVSRSTTIGVAEHGAELAVRGLQVVLGTATDAAREGDKCPAHPAGAAEAVCPKEPAVLPGAVVMRGEEGVVAGEPMPPVRDLVGGRPVAGGAEESEPALMPRAEDDAPRMPPVVDECRRPQPKTAAKPSGPEHAPRMSEECEPVLPKLRPDGGEKPKHPEVDTMEVRPSDLWFLDFTGPF